MHAGLTLSDHDRDRLAAALERFPGLPRDTANAIIADIGQSGLVRAFGYGSLVDSPHTEIDRKLPASLPGWKKGFVCHDTHYRGTEAAPGMTLGLDASADPAASTEGAVLEKRVTNVDQAIDFFERLAEREIPPGMDIYTFDFLTVETAQGSLSGMVCVANKASALYVGEGLTADQKAAIIAVSLGALRHDETGAPVNAARGRRTNFQYVQNSIVNDLELGRDPDPDMLTVFLLSAIGRSAMATVERASLEQLENPLTAAQRGEVLAAGRRAGLVSEAQLHQAAAGMTPLPPDRGPALTTPPLPIRAPISLQKRGLPAMPAGPQRR